MPRCYLFPGFFGTTLYRRPDLTSQLWIDYTSLALGRLGQARLASDGVSPGGPDGVQLYYGAALEDYYATAIASLVQSMRGTGYEFRAAQFDWRFALLGKPPPT